MSLGDREQVGNEGAFAATRAACVYGGALYTSGEGQIWKIDLESGEWERVHEADDWETRFLVGFQGSLCIVENDGTPYSLDLSTGTAEPGSEGEYEEILYAAACGDRLFGMTGNMVAKLEDGSWQIIDGIERGDVRAMVEHDESGFWLLTETGLNFIGVDGEAQDAGGAEAWNGTRTLAQYDGKLYYVWEDGNLYGYDISNGEEMTISETGDWTAKFIFAFGGSLYIVDDAGTLFRCSLS